jgi:hypothetical protein
VLDFRPDEGWSFVDLAPTLLINEADLAATELVQPGSRVSYRLLFAGERGAVDAFKAELEERLAEGEQLDDIRDTNPQIRSSMERSGRFLNLASLVSVLLAAVAVAMAARRYSHRHRDRIALMKCMGESIHHPAQQPLATADAGARRRRAGHCSASGPTRPRPADARPDQRAATGTGGPARLVTALSILAGCLPDLAQMGKTPPCACCATISTRHPCATA